MIIDTRAFRIHMIKLLKVYSDAPLFITINLCNEDESIILGCFCELYWINNNTDIRIKEITPFMMSHQQSMLTIDTKIRIRESVRPVVEELISMLKGGSYGTLL